MVTPNRPFPSCFEPHYESEAKSKVFVMKISFHSYASLQCRRIFGAGALNNPSLLSSWARKRERAGASQK